MASPFPFFLFPLLFFTSPSIAKTSFRPALSSLLAVTKDSSTSLQYITQIHQRTPLVAIKLTLDLGAQLSWVVCNHGYVSSSYKPARCPSAQCSLARTNACQNCYDKRKPGCNNNTCSHFSANNIDVVGSIGELAEDVVSLHSTDGLNPGRAVSVPRFIFTCGYTFLLEGLANGVKGMVELSRTRIGLPSQFSKAYIFSKKFALCLSCSTRSHGVLFFGDGPYVLLPNVEVSKSLIYTPLIKNPVSPTGVFFPGEYYAKIFIGVKSIKINGKVVPLNATLLSINKEGYGGTKISTINPYTVMETSIYNAFTRAFMKQLSNVPRVMPVAPFGTCYSSNNLGSTRVSPGVPPIDLVLHRGSVYWMIFGSNSMVQVSDTVLCLGFVDGGVNPRTSIVIGGHQIEDNLLQFDLAKSMLGFSSSLLFRQTTCTNFNFTSRT